MATGALRRLCVSALNRRPPPIIVQQTAKAGRGVFATRDIMQGELIHSADPVVAHPALDNISKVCYSCLKWIDHRTLPMRDSVETLNSSSAPPKGLTVDGDDNRTLRAEAPQFCSAPCAENAKKFYIIESRADWSELHQYCRENNVKFPLVAKRLACMVAGGAASSDALEVLSCPLFPHATPIQWNEEWALIVSTLRGASVQSSVLECVISRLYINSFGIEIINTTSHLDLSEALACSISGEGYVGPAVYLVPSMHNHDCDPNVDVRWPFNATMKLEARRMIKAGEELCITYLDASQAYNTRQKTLRHSYGFVCECPRCGERD